MVNEQGGRVAIVATAHGPVEYAERGVGPPVLMLHGTPGGYDQGLAVARILDLRDYRIIAPSRPGYLGTSLAVGRDPLSQADACAGLLDALGIRRASILSNSGGGIIATAFALAYPERAARLVLLQSITARMEIAADDLFRAALLLPLALRIAPAVLAQALRRRESRLVATALALARSTLPTSLRRAGVLNDSRQISALHAVPFADIRIPTLLVHGTADLNAPYEQSVAAAAALPDARLLTVPDGDHSSVLFEPRVAAAIDDFLRRA